MTGLTNKAVNSILSRKFSSPANYQDSFMNKVPAKPRTPSVKQKSKPLESGRTERIMDNAVSQSNVNLGMRYKNSFAKQKLKDEMIPV